MRTPCSIWCAGPVTTGVDECHVAVEAMPRQFSTRNAAYIGILYSHLPELVTVVRGVAGVTVEDGGTDSLELDGGGGSVGWRWSQASSQACCSVVNGGYSESIRQVSQRGIR